MRIATLISLFLLPAFSAHSQLIINEISQGSGSQEYVEFLVMGSSTCANPVPTVDLRGIVIDDNNGYFASGGGTGIAQGAVRFSNTAFWSAIPQGTIIVIYSDSDPNPAVPADDASISDGNCTLIIPANSMLLEGQAISPTTSDPSYPANASWVAGGGTWGQIAMSNSNDSFQIRASINASAPTYSVSWGNNTSGPQISFTQAANAVFSFNNVTNNNPLVQANWVEGVVGTNETPGLPNSIENATWIGGMNPQCYAGNGLSVVLTPANSQCGSNCTGSVTSVVSGGSSPYTYQWSNGFTTPGISSLCPATYTVTVTDANGCSTVESAVVGQSGSINVQALYSNESCTGYCDGGAGASASGGVPPYSFSWSNGVNSQANPDLCPGQYIVTVTDQNGCTGTTTVTIGAGNTTPNSSIPDPGTHYENETAIQLLSQNSGGTWTSSCGTCVSATGIFDPTESGLGTFEVCYTMTSSAGCTSTTCDSITITTQGCTDVILSEFVTICDGDTVIINGIAYTEIGTYQQVVSLSSGCDSILNIYLSLCLDTNYTIEIPNVITSNGDGVNDIWEPKTTGLILESGTIINRWGNTVKILSSTDLTWDGKDCTEGVYFYELIFKNALDEVVEKNGFIHLFIK